MVFIVSEMSSSDFYRKLLRFLFLCVQLQMIVSIFTERIRCLQNVYLCDVVDFKVDNIIYIYNKKNLI